MAIDFDKIRNKLAKISGQGNSATWRPEPGKKYALRILPWPDGNDGQPFKERAFYYNIGGGRAILAPFQFNQPDPIQDLIRKLQNEGTPEALEMCKQFYAKRRYYAPVVVRGEFVNGEVKDTGDLDKGVKLWGFGKRICQSLLEAMVEQFGDITDVKEGRDIIVKCVQEPGKTFTDTTAVPMIDKTPLGSAKQTKEWLNSVPDLDELYTQMSADDIEKRVNDHLNGASDSNGTEKKQPSTRDSNVEVSSGESTNIEDAFAKMKDLVSNAD